MDLDLAFRILSIPFQGPVEGAMRLTMMAAFALGISRRMPWAFLFLLLLILLLAYAASFVLLQSRQTIDGEYFFLFSVGATIHCSIVFAIGRWIGARLVEKK